MKLDPARRSSDSHHAASGRLLLHPVAIAALVVLVDCVVPIDITVIYDSSMNAPVADDPDANPEPTESEPGFVRLKWTVEARLEAFDGRPLPADALTLTTD